ncbi:MAG: ECF transporter S component [Dehalococcoidia bacterium]|nr:ECF transporter S component [Dehalococcoidia bacterium]
MLASIRRDFSTITLALIPIAIVLNIVGPVIVRAVGWNTVVFLDSLGTILVAILCGPWAGLLTGVLTNVIAEFVVNPGFLPFAGVAGIIGFVAGWLARFGMFRSWWKAIVSGLIIALALTPVAAATRIVVVGGLRSTFVITVTLVAAGVALPVAVVIEVIARNALDKAIVALLAYLIVRGIGKRALGLFPRADNVIPTPPRHVVVPSNVEIG